ncbi:MAG: rhamnulokinase [Planctomycetaceae bacterium]|nr:rhamnulokinase [Planctomycetaceae bacterium]
MGKTAYVAFDLGAESGRAMLGVLDDGRLTLEEVHRFANIPQRLPSGLHWNLGEMWEQLVEGLRLAVVRARAVGVTIRSLGVDTWGVDYGVIGASGQLLGLPFAYRDERNLPAFEKVMARLGEARLFAATGIQFMQFNTLFQLAAQHEAEPAVLNGADRILFMPDLLHYFFSGVAVNEASVASTTQMIDPRTGAWATGLLDELGLPTQYLKEIVPAGTVLGALRADVAEATGAPAELKVIMPASHDTASAVAAAPAEEGGKTWCYLSSGTWSLMGVELDEPNLSDAARDVPFTNEGGVAGEIRFLKNISGLWLVQQCRAEYERAGNRYEYDQLAGLAAAAPGFVTLVDPDHGSFAAAGEMPTKIAAFAEATGQPKPKDVGATVRCCLESLALTYRHTLLRLERVLDQRIEVVHVVGGGGRNGLLNQMTSDATGRRVVAGPYEATAVGNVLVQAMGAGDVRDREHIRAIVRESFEPVTYEPRETGDWDGTYERYLGVLGK